MQRSTDSGGRSTRTPSASSTSAAPQRPDAARLPCLATRNPAPAATSAAAVDRLKLPTPSPPVPTESTNSPSTRTFSENSRITAAIPAISSVDSPLSRNAVSSAASCAGVVSPNIIRRITAAAWSIASDWPDITVSIASRISKFIAPIAASVRADYSMPLGTLRRRIIVPTSGRFALRCSDSFAAVVCRRASLWISG